MRPVSKAMQPSHAPAHGSSHNTAPLGGQSTLATGRCRLTTLCRRLARKRIEPLCMPRSRFRFALTLLAAGLVFGVTVSWALSDGGASHRSRAVAADAGAGIVRGAGAASIARFAFLSRQTSNSCGLQPAVLLRMPD